MNTHTGSFGYSGTLSSELVAFAKRQLVNATMYKGDQRRRETRCPMMLPVMAVPVDSQFKPIGDPFEMITRDVSSQSIGLIHAQQLVDDRIAIHLVLAGTQVDLVIELCWSEPMGPFYGSGGVYLAKLNEFPCHLACLDTPMPRKSQLFPRKMRT